MCTYNCDCTIVANAEIRIEKIYIFTRKHTFQFNIGIKSLFQKQFFLHKTHHGVNQYNVKLLFYLIIKMNYV